jgi:hypothetical protein
MRFELADRAATRAGFSKVAELTRGLHKYCYVINTFQQRLAKCRKKPYHVIINRPLGERWVRERTVPSKLNVLSLFNAFVPAMLTRAFTPLYTPP